MQPFFESSIPKIEHPEVQSWANELLVSQSISVLSGIKADKT